MEICKLCGKGCVLAPSQQRDGLFTKECRFVKYLEFDERTFRRINGGHQETISAVFSDLMQHKTDEMVLYLADKDSQMKRQGGNGPCIVSVEPLVSKLETRHPQRLDLEIANLARYYTEGSFRLNQTDRGFVHSLLISSLRDYRSIMKELEDLCLFEYLLKDEHNIYHITPKGYEAAKCMNISSTAFIALAYTDNDEVIKTISDCIRHSGFEPVIMKDLQHNNNIMDEMLKQIRNCRFLVCDLTIPNYGAYFEAGYAMALGHAVILSCRDDVFHSDLKPHFDVSQYNFLRWIDLVDLNRQLTRRINDTILNR